MSDDELLQRLKSLGLHAIAAQLADVLATAARTNQDPRAWLEALVACERAGRQQRSLERRTARACLGRFKPLDAFEWDWPQRIDRAGIEAALRLDFVRERRNVLFVAPPGLGKTTLAKNLAHRAILAGHTVRFTSATAMLNDLASVEGTPHLFRQRLRRYTTPDLLVCDEVGYLSYQARAADLLFHVVNERHGEKPLVLSTNLPFSDWGTVFPNATCVVAMIDRLVENAAIFVLEGESYRQRDAGTRRSGKKSGAP